ncbi:Tad domain-containing protein [Aneurinibacillus thermoaerophilus]|uniref:TadE/TadG family type IV pilus assembly protein n=1 Tax=Aneurinibacillus thermoaerophilus TaxID=143495 RepID=UPI002E23077C|nr:Tad domain-containing protein [Aneurinibacillus thermoaerophilus]
MGTVKNEKGAAILLTVAVSTVILLIIAVLFDAGMYLHYRHQLQTAADAGSLAGVSRSSITTNERNEEYIDPVQSVNEAKKMIYRNLYDIHVDTKLDNGTLASDGSEYPYYTVDRIVARPLSDIEFETKIEGKILRYFAPWYGAEKYADVRVISRTKLIRR